MDGSQHVTADKSKVKPAKVDPHQRPRDASTLIILDTSHGPTRILFGKRRMDQKFMPGKYVFPGGRVDPADLRVKTAETLAATEVQKLLRDIKGRPSERRVNAFALAAVRETYEETGLLLGTTSAAPGTSSTAIWQKFFSQGVAPRLSAMTFLARAITPPGKPRRYDTRFFCVRAEDIALKTSDSDGELTETHWLTLDEAKTFDLPTIQRAILEDLADRLKQEGHLGPSAHPVPFYHMKNGTFRRDLLTVGGTTAHVIAEDRIGA
jgi:8-oxo-dGTP pyrophosphatase MutT (NUDIX family)